MWAYQGNGVIEPAGDYRLNPKVELKNINSFRAVEKAIDYEAKRQITALAEGEKLVQETRGWNESQGKTVRQRIKETSADYRYFPEPDIPPLFIDSHWLDRIKTGLIELPPEKIKRFKEQYDFSDYDAEILVSDRFLADYTEKVISELRAWIDAGGDNWERQKKKLAKAAANWLTGELFKHLNAAGQSLKDTKITPENFAEFITINYQGKVNSSAAQQIFKVMYEKGGDPTDIMTELGLEQIDDKAELEKIIKDIIAKNQAQADQFRNGKENVLQYFIGQTMAATKGKANPKIVQEILKKQL
jgi:aspartyl-tRNA(Asn)/glutamyl-tRNA(Gln) amidotransferase subunit B